MITHSIFIVNHEVVCNAAAINSFVQSNVSETFFMGHQELSFAPINSQLAARGGGVEVVVRKSMTEPSTTIFYIVIKTTFKKYFTTLIST